MDYNFAKKYSILIKKHIKGLYETGSLIRKEKEIHDLDFITMRNLDDVYEDFKKYFEEQIQDKKGGEKYISFKLRDIHIDIWKADNKTELFFKRFLRSLDKGHTIGLRKIAKNKGYKLTETGLYRNNELINIKNMKELIDILS